MLHGRRVDVAVDSDESRASPPPGPRRLERRWRCSHPNSLEITDAAITPGTSTLRESKSVPSSGASKPCHQAPRFAANHLAEHTFYSELLAPSEMATSTVLGSRGRGGGWFLPPPDHARMQPLMLDEIHFLIEHGIQDSMSTALRMTCDPSSAGSPA